MTACYEIPAAEPRRLALAAQRLLGRHSLLVGLFRLWRADTRAPTWWGERDYRGVAPPPARLRALDDEVSRLGAAQQALESAVLDAGRWSTSSVAVARRRCASTAVSML